MNTNKLDKAFIHTVKDKYGQSLEVNDVVLYSKGNALTEGIILDIKNNSLLLHNRDRFIDGSEVVLINDLYNKKQLSTTNILIDYNNNQKLNNTIYLFYAVLNGEEGFIFFKPKYQGSTNFITEYQQLISKYKDIIVISFKEMHIPRYDYFNHYMTNLFNSINLDDLDKFNIATQYNVYIPFGISDKFYTGMSIRPPEMLRINSKFKFHWLTHLKFQVELNKFLPISFNHTLDNKVSLEIENNSIDDYFVFSSYTINELYNTLKFTYHTIIPTIISKFNQLDTKDKRIYNCYYQLNELNIKNNYF